MNKEVDILVSKINELDFVKRLKELEGFIDSNEELKTKIDEIKDIQKKLVNSSYYKLKNATVDYKEKREILINEVKDIPFVEEYIDLLNESYYMIKNIIGLIEEEINNSLK